jgi:hypothetical protein
MSADGRRVAIGGYKNDGNGAEDSGHVRVFDWDNTTWSQVGDDIDGEAADDDSGWSVAISADGNRVAIGAPFNAGNAGSCSGHVRVFDWDNTTWSQVGDDIDGEAAGDDSGWSVAMSADGNRVAIGADINSGNAGSYSGHVRVFDWDNTTWSQVGDDIDGEAAGDESSIVAMSADGRRLAIGAGFNDGNYTDNNRQSGHVRIFDWVNNTWTQNGDDIDGKVPHDNLGVSVAMSRDGSRVAIGATSVTGACHKIPCNGVVRVYLNSSVCIDTNVEFCSFRRSGRLTQLLVLACFILNFRNFRFPLLLW